MDHTHHNDPNGGSKTNSRITWVLICFLAIAAYFLILEHQAHLSGLLNYLPYLLLLACPLMHLFMHGGHGGHGGHSGHGDDGKQSDNAQSKGEQR